MARHHRDRRTCRHVRRQRHLRSGRREAATTINTSTISHNTAATNGGGIAYPGTGDVLSIQRSTIHHNDAGVGGGVWGAALGTSEVLKSTIVLNSSNNRGGSLSIAAQTAATVVAVKHSTIGDAWLEPTGTFDFYHVILSSCRAGTFTSLGYNLISVAGCTLVTQSTDITGVSANLGPLTKLNGGVTATQAIGVGSPAYNRGHPSDCTEGGNTDQRGTGFLMPTPLRNCDIGAYQRQ